MKFHKIIISILMICLLTFVAFGASPPDITNAETKIKIEFSDVSGDIIPFAETAQNTVKATNLGQIKAESKTTVVQTTVATTSAITATTAADPSSSDERIRNRQSQKPFNKFTYKTFQPFAFRQTETVKRE